MGGAVARQGRRKGDFLAGKYLLEDTLGIGGMGEVYRATNVSLGRKVAIKILAPEYVDKEEDVLAFLREARAAAGIRHANVVDVLDVARDEDGTPFIVQELLAGDDLERHLKARGGMLSFSEALEIMIPVADAVAAAHAQNVVHRDLKPANIFLARERDRTVPKVLDFGACLFPTITDRSAKEARMLVGTPHYMAPEQIMSKADVDARSDVWALGIILFELIVGETPFEADTAKAVMDLVKTRDVPPLRSRSPGAPPELEALIASCTKRDRLARLRNASAVHEAMRALQKKLSPEPWSPAPPKTKPKTPPVVSTARPRLNTLSSPDDEPPAASFDSLDLDLPLPPAAQPPARPAKDERSGARDLEPESPATFGEADLGAPPSAPPKKPELDDDDGDSLPPVLFGAAPAPAKTPSAPPLAHEHREVARLSSLDEPPPAPAQAAPASDKERPPAVLAKDFSAGRRERGTWSVATSAKLGLAVAVPTLLEFFAVRFVPQIGMPLGRALRGDSLVASGVLAVVALVFAVAACARALLGEPPRSRWLTATAVASVLFLIVMIIVTFSASEAAETGVSDSMAGLSTLVAPLAPLVLALASLRRARNAWIDPYARGEAAQFVLLSSVLLCVTLAVSPVGAVRTTAARDFRTILRGP